jgi:glycosyltransferase involved in cell wall biosynthesis
MASTPLLFVSSYVGLGGGETDLLTLAANLDAGYDRHLLLPYEGQLSERWRDLGGTVHTMHWRGATVYFVPALWGRFPVTQRIETLIREQGIRAIHCDYHTLPLVLPAARRVGIPVIWTCWGWWFQPKFWQRDFFQGVDKIFARSQAIKDGFLGNPPFLPPEQIDVVHSGVDTTRFQPDNDGLRVRFQASVDQDAPVVALIARFQDVKGHHIFQAMAQQVALQIPDVRFLVAGEDVHGVAADSAYKQRILDQANSDPLLRKRMIYLGFRDDSERVIAAADVVVCSSFFESYGIVNVEAMASGKPVVSTSRGGPSETVVDRETGFLVEPGDAEGLARQVITLLRDQELRQRMGQAGRKRVEERFSAQAMTAVYHQALDELLNKS